MSAKYLGNCSHLVDFDLLVNKLLRSREDALGPTQTFNSKTEHLMRAGYVHHRNGGNVKWKMYYPETSFDKSVISNIIEFANIPSYTSAWISRVDPGCCVPPHSDSMKAVEKNYRMHVFLEDSIIGHVFYLENQYFLNYKKGDVFLWNDPAAIHGAANISLVPKFLLNIY